MHNPQNSAKRIHSFIQLLNCWLSIQFITQTIWNLWSYSFSVLKFRGNSAELCGMDLNIIKSVIDNVYTCLRLWPLTLFGLSNNIRCCPQVETRMTIPPFEWQGTNKPNWHKITGATSLPVQNFWFVACQKCMETTSAFTLNSPTVRGMSYLGRWRQCPSPMTPHWRTPAQQRGWGTWRRPRCPAWTFGPPREPCKVPWTLFIMRQRRNRCWNLLLNK